MLGTVWLLGMEGARHLLPLWCHEADPMEHPMDQEMFDGAGGLLHSCMSWHCPEGGLVRPRSSSQCGEQDVQGRSWECRGKRGCARVEGPLQRGLLGVEVIPRLGSLLPVESDHHEGTAATIQEWWQMVVTDGE